MKTKPHRRRVIFPQTFSLQKTCVCRVSRPDRRSSELRLAEMKPTKDNDDDSVESLPIRERSVLYAARHYPVVPALYTSLPPIKDILVTNSSEEQDETAEECIPYLAGTADPTKSAFDFNPHGVARLEREEHTSFLIDALQFARFMAYDPTRPWNLYWSLTGLSLLGHNVSQYQTRWVSSLMTDSSFHGKWT